MDIVKRSPVVWAACGTVFGYYGGFWNIWNIWFFVAAGVVFLCFVRAAVYLTKERFWRSFARLLSALLVGAVIGIYAHVNAQKPLQFGVETQRIKGILGIVRDDPRFFGSGGGIGRIAMHKVLSNGGVYTSARGTVTVFFPKESLQRLREFGRKATVFVEGTYETSREAPVFSVRSVHIYRAAPPFEQWRTAIRSRIINRFAHSAYGGLSLALILGFKDTLNPSLARYYQDAGCSHVLALSGMHVAIIAAVLAYILKKPLGLNLSSLVCALCILGYTVLVGAQPSLVRATSMYLIGTFAVLGALPKKPLLILSLSFIIQIIVQPESGLSVAFMLSYLAIAGILFLSPSIYALIRGYIPDIAAQPLAASLSAFIATSATVNAVFGILRPFGILSGLIIVPITTVFMLLSFLFLAVPVAPVGYMLNGLYTVISQLSFISSHIPGISVPEPLVRVLVPTVILILISVETWITRQRTYCRPF